MPRSVKLPLWGHQFRQKHATFPLTNSLTDHIGSIKGCLSSACRKEFLERCWDLRHTNAEWLKDQRKFDYYFSSYEEFCQVDRPHVLTTRSHADLCDIARTLALRSRKQVENDLLSTLVAPFDTLRDAQFMVAFIGKAILRIDLTNWQNDETLQENIKRSLGSISRQTDRDRLPPTFNAATFSMKAGIQVLWQPIITSHLDIAFGDTTLKLFHDVALLDLLEKGPFKDVFPPHFVEKTRRTIDLMLPKSEPRCRQWLEKELEGTPLGVSTVDSAFHGVVDRHLQTFDFWRDRLIVAKDVFDTSQPKGLRQLLRDDRNKVQYWTFWIAIIVFWLTLGGFITGCLQTYKTFHPSPQPPWPVSAA